MNEEYQFENNRFLLEFAGRLDREWTNGHASICSPELQSQIGLVEEMAMRNKCVYSLFDFEQYRFLYHTKNFFDLLGLDKSQEDLKWEHAYLSHLEDHRPVEKFLSLRKELQEMFPEESLKDFQSTTCGCFLTNMKGERMRAIYRSKVISFDESGKAKVCFDSLSNIREMMISDPGYWIRFSFADKAFHWHSLSPKLIAKDIISPRETELVSLWKSGLSIPEIAEQIHVSNFTVKNQLTNARKRLMARDNTSLAQLCTLAGVLETSF